jgi:uncharacterized protein
MNKQYAAAAASPGVYGWFAAKGRHDWWRYLLAAPLGVVFGVLVFAIGYEPLFLAHLLPPTIGQDLLRPNRPVVFFLGAGAEFGAMVAGFTLAIRLVHAKKFDEIIGAWSWRLAGAGAGLWLLVQLVGLAADTLAAPHSLTLTLSRDTPALALAAILGLGVQTFAEEFVFRGYLTQGLLMAFRKPLPTALVSGLLFGALHIWNGLPQAANAVVFGAVAALLAMRTGGLAFTFGLHFVNNLFGAVVVVSSTDVFRGSPGLFTQNAPQLAAYDVVVAAGGLLLVLWATHRLGLASAPSRANPDQMGSSGRG